MLVPVSARQFLAPVKILFPLRRTRLGGSRGVPVLVPVRASPVPSEQCRARNFLKFFLS